MIEAIKRIYGANADKITGDITGRSRYTEKDKRRALALFDKLKSYGEVEKETGVSRNTVRAWQERYGANNTLKAVDDMYKKNVNRSTPTGMGKVKPNERRNLLCDFIKNDAFGVPDLAEALKVTTMTIRNDILYLIAHERIINISQNKKVYLVKAV